MTARVHVLKTWPEPFQAILDGRKRYEIRVDDRGFAVGDTLHLREWQPYETSNVITGDSPTDVYIAKCPPHFTGRELFVRVAYKTEAGEWGLTAGRPGKPGVCVMSIEVVP